CWIDIVRWNEPDPRPSADAINVHFPPIVVDSMVARLAEQHPVHQVGSTVMSLPPPDVMSFGQFGWKSAHCAAAVPFDERQPLSSSEQPLLPAPIENFAVPAEDTGDDAVTRGHSPGCADADWLICAV